MDISWPRRACRDARAPGARDGAGAGAGAAGGHGRQDAGRTSAGAASGRGRTQPGRIRGSGRTGHCCTTLPRMLRIARALNAPALGSVRRAIVLPGRARAKSRRTKPSATFGRKSGSASPMLPRRTQAGRESEPMTISGVVSTPETYARWEKDGQRFAPLLQKSIPSHLSTACIQNFKRRLPPLVTDVRHRNRRAPPAAFSSPAPPRRPLQISFQYPLTPYTMYHIV